MLLKVLVIESGIKEIEFFKIKVILDNTQIFYATSFLDVFDLLTKDQAEIILLSDFKGSDTTLDYIKMLNNINPDSRVIIHSINKKITEEIKYFYIQRGADDILSYNDYEGFINKFNYYLINKIDNNNNNNWNIYTKKTVKYILDNFNDSDSIKEFLKTNLSCSDSLLNHYIKNDTGKSFGTWVREKKIKTAQSLLIKTKLPVKTISNKIGYKTIQGFIKIFKKITGKCPLKYRKEFKLI